MTDPAPVSLGRFSAVKAGDIVDRYLDISGDLVPDEAIESVTYTLLDAAGEEASSGAVTGSSLSSGRADFRLKVPDTPGTYSIIAAFTVDDGQKITKTATLPVV